MNYLRWHYIDAPKFILSSVDNYIYFLVHFFSVKILFKTLFSPWRREIAQKSKPGINFTDILNVLSFNIISRVLGFIVRLFALLSFTIFLVLFIFLGVFLFLGWLLIPVISLPIYLLIRQKSNLEEKDKFIKSHFETGSKASDVNEVSIWYEHIRSEEDKKGKFWSKENLSSISPLGASWVFGYTPLLDQLTSDLSKASLNLEKFVGREDEITLLETTLAKEKGHNALLVGEPGTGRLTIAIGLAKLIESGKAAGSLSYKRILSLNMDQLLSKNLVETQQNIAGVLEEARQAGNIILVIPSLEEFIKNPEINIARVLIEHLGENDVQVIGITDPSSYQKYFRPDPNLLKIFEKIEISEIPKDEALEVLENMAIDLEKKYKITISYEALVEITEKSEELIADVPLPQKAIDLLDEAFVSAKTKGLKQLTVEDVDLILSIKTKMPIGELTQKEKAKLEDLENILHKRVVGQNLAITKICDALKRKRAGVEAKNSPIGTFLFVGPTGVGKTETAKALAESYFGSEDKIIRFDMSEFQNDSDIQKLIGDGNNPGVLTSSVRDNPFTVLLLDEFEKANQKILNLFLTVFDEGYLADSQDKKVSFKNTIIIATSNAGSEFIREKMLANTPEETLEKEVLNYLLANKIFSPELINRFDSVVFYKPLNKDEIEKIASLILDAINKKVKDEKEITIKLSGESLAKIVEKGYDPTFGARNLQRIIQEEVENQLADKILKNQVKKGSTVEINL